MSEQVCVRCGEVIPCEADTNRRVAELAQRPNLGAIVATAIWPDASLTGKKPCGDGLIFADQSTGADWVVTCQDGAIARQAEHKPWWTNSHWPPATVEDYRRALDESVIQKGPKWPGIPSPTHQGRHRGRAWKDDCWSCASVKWTGGQFTRLAIPQVVLYCVRTSLPCTLVSDRGPASVAYSTEPWFTISPVAVPVRTISEILNSLASSANNLHLSSSDTELLQDVVTRLWWPSPWEALSTLSESATALVRPSALQHWRECEPA
jgi:hypothetical protein